MWLPGRRLVQQRHVAVRRGHRAGGVAGQAAAVVGGDSVAHAAVPSTSVIIGVHITAVSLPWVVGEVVSRVEGSAGAPTGAVALAVAGLVRGELLLSPHTVQLYL